MKKKVVKIILIATLCIPLPLTCMNVQAKNECKNLIEERTYRSDSFTDANLVGSKIDTPTLYNNYGEIQKTTNLTNYKTVYVTPSGQPLLGFEYVPNENNTVFFFYTSGNVTKFTVKIDYKNVEFEAETGYYSESGGGYSSQIPDSPGCYKFQFIKNYVIKTKKIDVYKYGEYQYTYYVHDPQYSLGQRWVRL